MRDLYSRIAELIENKKTFCVVTVVDSSGATPRKAGARGIVFPDGSIEGTVGGGSIELTAIADAIDAMKSGDTMLKHYPLESLADKMSCGGSMTLYFEPNFPGHRLTIFGGGHVGRAIVPVAAIAGWQVTVVDQREEVLDQKFFPDDARLIHSDYTDYIKSSRFDSHDWIVIVTPQHKFDQDVLELFIDQKCAYLGMMGSDVKVKEVMDNLQSKGYKEDQLSTVYAPIGLNIGRETPGEIAISIVSQMLSVLNNVKEIRCLKQR
ncbi:MAG: XdhC/CoxI family protein [candidate division KSB1 bacterium]|jgi:xanthine dehydrogenase accessory factor|nr:XdhC/CoxI family protein [candidate division KSB1 bacterium]